MSARTKKDPLTVRTPGGQKGVQTADSLSNFRPNEINDLASSDTLNTVDTPCAIPRMPSIVDIGRWVMALNKTHDQLDDEAIGVRRVKATGTYARERELARAMTLASERGRALRDLALSLPPRSIGDVAVQLVYAWHEVDSLEASELEEEHARRTLRRIRRVLLGGLPIAIAAAGISAEDITFASDERFSRDEFPDLGDGA
jgi:hypothetical protein